MDAIGQEIAPGRYVCIEVSDTGGGIAPEMQAKIFDPFFTTKFTGRGLGLAAVAGILRSQRGGITLQSTPGSGSTFRVCLPIGTHRVEETADAAVAAGQATILVVDDEAAVRDFIGSVLRRKGYRVLSAADGQEALRICGDASGSVDAAVVDIIMPNMAANDLLPALKSIVPRIRVLLTSGYSESEARRLCVVHPDASFIQKPYTAQHLAKAVSDLLS
jgi:CheY-like chemotaxis protein